MPLPIAALASGIGSLFNIGVGLFQNRKANKIKPVDVTYKESPYAKDQYGLARQYLNARMPGASQQEQNILASQGNMLANVQRNASDSGQALAMAAAGQAQTNQSFADLGLQEAQNKQNMLSNFNQASGVMINEGDKVYQDQLRKYNNAVSAKNALRNAAWQNIGQGVNGLVNGATQFFGGSSIGGGSSSGNSVSGVMPSASVVNTASAPNTMGVFGNLQAPVSNPSWANQWQAPMLMNPQQTNAWNQPRLYGK